MPKFMVVYNITTKVHPFIDAAWLQWQQQEHIPETMATGFFTQYKMFRLLEQDDNDGNTYAVQYTAGTLQQYHAYIDHYASLLLHKAEKRWGNKTLSFCSVLELI